MFFVNYFNKAKAFYLKYEKPLLLVSFFTGLLWDNFTLRRIDLLYENVVFLWNLFLAIIIILLINAQDAGRLRGKIFERIVVFLPIFLQFSFGNLFSGFIVFYVRSGSIFASWPFLLFLAFLFVGNEFFRKRYLHLPFQVSILFIALFSYSAFALPVLLNQMSDFVFLGSGALALLLISLILAFFYLIMKEKLKANLKPLFFSIGGVYLAFQILYFTNIIPPIPLSLKDSGIFHSIERVNYENYFYQVTFEKEASPYLFFKDQSDVFHLKAGSPIYCYSAIFSPADLNVIILHRWSYFDEKEREWVEHAKIPFKIIGGRVQGYRGYTFITSAKEGKWRVDVINERGQVLGRRDFKVVKTNTLPNLETSYR